MKPDVLILMVEFFDPIESVNTKLAKAMEFALVTRV